MNKKTAIDWLIEQMFKQGYFDGNKPLSYTNLKHLQNQAKEIEKEQIINAFDRFPLFIRDLNGIDYYEKIYGGGSND